MTTIENVLLTLGAAATITCGADGAIEVLSRGPTDTGWTTAAGVTIGTESPKNVTIDGAQEGFYYRVRETGGGDIGKIVFTDSPVSITLLIGGQATSDVNQTDKLPDAGCANWIDGLDSGNATVTLQARVSGDIRRRNDSGPDSAEIKAERIVRLDIGGDLNKVYIRHQSTTAELSAIVVDGNIVDDMTSDSTGHSIQSAGGRIVLVQATGDIRAPIRLQFGDILAEFFTCLT